MPTKRKRRERFHRPEVDPVHWSLLTDSPLPDDGDPFAIFDFDVAAHGLWDRFRDRIMVAWLEVNPGTRPQHWWKFDAPEPRRLLKGPGRPAWERLCIAPGYRLGIPAMWTDGDPGLLVFESQYGYLQRHGLLEPGEGESIEPVVVPGDWRLSSR